MPAPQMASLAKECLARRSGRVGAWIDSVLPLVRERVGGQTAVAAEAAAVGLVAGMAAGRTQYSQAELRAVVGAWSAVFVAELIVAGANASAVDFAGRTPLHVAALAGNAPAAAQLVSRRSGAAAAAARALTALDRVRATAGDIAAARGHGDVLAVLQSSAARCGAATRRTGAGAGGPHSVSRRWEAPRGASAAEVAAGRAAVKRVLALLPAVPPRLRRPLLASPVATGGGRGSGGWGGEPTGGDAVRGCDIEQLASLTPKDFLERYGRARGRTLAARSRTTRVLDRFYSPGVPVLLRGGAGAWPFRAEWTRDGFLASVGDVSFSAAAIPYPHFFGGNSSRVIAREFVAAMRYRGGNDEVPYIFERPALRELAPALLGHFPPIPPEFTLPPAMQQSPAQPQFFVGAPGSGAPVHFHAGVCAPAQPRPRRRACGHAPHRRARRCCVLLLLIPRRAARSDAWNAIAHGAKRWFLFPPATAFYSIVPAAQWFREHYGNLTGDARPLECVTEAGDLIFVPRDWGHGVLNLEETIGVASEFYSVFSRY